MGVQRLQPSRDVGQPRWRLQAAGAAQARRHQGGVPAMTKATSFSEREMQICTVARMIEDGKSYWVAGGGGPMYAILMGKKLYAPNAQYITEDGVIAPEPMLPFDPIMTMVAARAGYRALAWGTMNTAANHAQLGLMDYGILNTLQVDQYGNINSTVIGTYGERMRRFGGPGGADSIAALCWRTILMTDQEKRKFVERVDFISSPGFLDGTPGARERAGLPRGTGPWRVVTPWAVFDYSEERRLRPGQRPPRRLDPRGRREVHPPGSAVNDRPIARRARRYAHQRMMTIFFS